MFNFKVMVTTWKFIVQSERLATRDPHVSNMLLNVNAISKYKMFHSQALPVKSLSKIFNILL